MQTDQPERTFDFAPAARQELAKIDPRLDVESLAAFIDAHLDTPSESERNAVGRSTVAQLECLLQETEQFRGALLSDRGKLASRIDPQLGALIERMLQVSQTMSNDLMRELERRHGRYSIARGRAVGERARLIATIASAAASCGIPLDAKPKGALVRTVRVCLEAAGFEDAGDVRKEVARCLQRDWTE